MPPRFRSGLVLFECLKSSWASSGNLPFEVAFHDPRKHSAANIDIPNRPPIHYILRGSYKTSELAALCQGAPVGRSITPRLRSGLVLLECLRSFVGLRLGPAKFCVPVRRVVRGDQPVRLCE